MSKRRSAPEYATLQASHRRLAALVRSAGASVVATTLEGNVTDWNAGAEQLFGYSAAEMMGQPISRLVPDERRVELSEILETVRGGSAVNQFETVRVCKDGMLRDVSVNLGPILDEAGRVVGISAITLDITEQKRTAAALREAHAALAEANQRKDRFIAMLGHELRNPLAAIRSAAELLELRGAKDDAIMAQVQEVLARQSAHMARLIDGLLDVARVTRGGISLEFGEIDLRILLESVIEDHAAELQRKTLELRRDLPDEPMWVMGDPVRLAQVFGSLMGNAIKYTRPGGTITVSAWCGDGESVVSIRDSGVGIRPELLETMFEAFQQEEQELSRPAGGLGLGLALVKGLVELHGGRIRAESEGRGAGAEFQVTLPVRPAQRAR